jgi:hypothetical protein
MQLWQNLRYSPDMYLGSMRKITKPVSHKSRYPGLDSNRAPSEIIPDASSFESL